MTANSFIAAEERCSTQEFRLCLRVRRILAVLDILHFFKVMGFALLPGFKYLRNTLLAHTDSCGMNSSYKK